MMLVRDVLALGIDAAKKSSMRAKSSTKEEEPGAGSSYRTPHIS